MIPLVYIALGSFQYDSWGPRYLPGAEPGSLTVFYWHRVLLSCMSTSIFWELFLHTPLIDSPGLWLGRIFLPYILPAWTLGLAWLTVFKNPNSVGNSGSFTVFLALNRLFGLAMDFFSFLLSGVLATIDVQLEESAEILGANWAKILS